MKTTHLYTDGHHQRVTIVMDGEAIVLVEHNSTALERRAVFASASETPVDLQKVLDEHTSPFARQSSTLAFPVPSDAKKETPVKHSFMCKIFQYGTCSC